METTQNKDDLNTQSTNDNKIIENNDTEGKIIYFDPDNLLDISDLCNLALYSLTEPKEMLRLLDELPEIRCDLLADNYEKIVKKIDEILA